MAVKLVVLPAVVIVLHVVAHFPRRVVAAAITHLAKMIVASVTTRDGTGTGLEALMIGIKR